MSVMEETMKRREFLKFTGALLISVLIAGCGGGSGENQTPNPSIKVKVDLEGQTSKIVTLEPNSTVVDAIKTAFPYQKGDKKTTINGLTGNWGYKVDNIEPSIYAGDYHLTTDANIKLYRF
jgi:hypothetical protein